MSRKPIGEIREMEYKRGYEDGLAANGNLPEGTVMSFSNTSPITTHSIMEEIIGIVSKAKEHGIVVDMYSNRGAGEYGIVVMSGHNKSNTSFLPLKEKKLTLYRREGMVVSSE